MSNGCHHGKCGYRAAAAPRGLLLGPAASALTQWLFSILLVNEWCFGIFGFLLKFISLKEWQRKKERKICLLGHFPNVSTARAGPDVGRTYARSSQNSVQVPVMGAGVQVLLQVP